MKRVCFLFLIFLFSIGISAQETPLIKIGAGMPIFFQQNFSDPGSGDLNLSRKRINLFAERPIPFCSNYSFSISPGLGYFLFHENYNSDQSALGGSSKNDLTHYAFSFYSKLLYHFTNNPEKSNHYYCGIVSGKYIYTKSKGESSWSMLQESHYIGSDKKIDENGRSFFHSFYYGFIVGFDSKSKESSRLAPAFEFSFYPDFITVNDKRRSMAIISVILRIKKRATQKNE